MALNIGKIKPFSTATVCTHNSFIEIWTCLVECGLTGGIFEIIKHILALDSFPATQTNLYHEKIRLSSCMLIGS